MSAWRLEAVHPQAPDVPVLETGLTITEAIDMAQLFADAGCWTAYWPEGESL